MGRLAALFLVLLSVGCGVPGPPDVPALQADAQRGDVRAHRSLLGLLGRSESPETRAAAYQALLAAGEKAGPSILAACADADAVRREHALALAGNLKLAGAFDRAVSSLEDAGFPRRYVAAWALGELADPRAVAPLIAAVSSEEGEIAREAARSLGKLGTASSGPLLRTLPRLRGEARGYALRILGEVRDPDALSALTRALADPATRIDAAWALGTLDRREARSALLPLLGDPAWRVRLEACRSLGLLAAREAEEPLERLRRSDPEPAVREWAARSLALLRGYPQTFHNARGELVEPENLYR